jgi:hypothetical protein
MTFIDMSGNRTVTGCSPYDFRKVYAVTASVVLDVCRSEWNEVVKTGEQVTETRVYHIVAETPELALALYKKNRGSEFQRHTLISIEPLFCLDGEITTGHK